MRKFYYLLATVVLSVIALTANAFNVTINVDNPDRVKVSVNYTEQEVAAGDNVFNIEAYTSIAIEAKTGAMLKSIVRTSDGGEEYVSNMTSCSIYPGEDKAGETWTVTSVNESDVRTGSCRVKVDDASKVRIQRSGTYSEVTLNDGWNDVYYIPETETQLMIASTDYTTPLYEVRQNGTKIESQYSTWYVTLQGGDEIEILANYPDVDVPVHFVYADEDSKDFITGVTVNEESVENYNADDFTVKAGAKLQISGNTVEWGVDEFSINGTPASFYSPYTLTVTEETTISIKAHKYGSITAYLDIDEPANIRVYKGYSYNNDLITGLVSGKNTIELPETNTMISIVAESGCYITTVIDDNQMQYYPDYSNSYNVTMTDGMTLTIVSGAIARDQEAIVYIDDRSAASQYFSFARSDRSEMEVTSGYNKVNFYSGDNPVMLSWYGAPYANVYQNDAIVNPQYEGSTTYQFQLTHGDILKIFLASNPKTYEVAFDMQISAEHISVIRDLIQVVENWQEGFKTLQGTQVEVKTDDETGIKVTVNDEILTPTEGSYTFIINENTTVKIEDENGNGIGNVATEGSTVKEVYNLQGVKVIENAAGNRISNLPSGLYIINGKKTLIR